VEITSDLVFATIGWIGAVLIVIGYALVATRRVSSHSIAFHVITLLGSLGLTMYALAIAAWPNVALNGFMLIVAGIGVVMAWRVVGKLRAKTHAVNSEGPPA
jgi:hypothetical protein